MGGNRIVKYSYNGQMLNSWGGTILLVPYGLKVNPTNGDIYVVDTGNHKIRVFDQMGILKFSWGELGQEDGQFIGPRRIAIDSHGYVYVTDGTKTRVQKFDQSGNFVSKWGEEGYNSGYMNPFDIYIDESDRIFVTDINNDQIQEFNVNGQLLNTWGLYGREPGQFEYPMGIALDEQNSIYVADAGNNRIQIFDSTIPQADPVSGLIQNGNFSESLDGWTRGGQLPISRYFDDVSSEFTMRLNKPVTQNEQGQDLAWAYSSFYVDPVMDQPMLRFKYNMFVNDIIDYSDFFVTIQDGVGLNHLEIVLRDGYPGSVAPPEGHNIGWRTARFDLSGYKGQHIRVVFSNRNLWPNSWGIWTYVDDVRVIEADELPPDYAIYLPLVIR